ncbi:hypothetical protein NL338_26250, partial [Klebsiella pneumoniae]|nr:hypothetical protein [Klebsiella pneumoniae]
MDLERLHPLQRVVSLPQSTRKRGQFPLGSQLADFAYRKNRDIGRSVFWLDANCRTGLDGPRRSPLANFRGQG